MTLNEIAKQIGVKNYDAIPEGMFHYYPLPEERKKELCSMEMIERLQEKFNFFGEYFDDVKERLLEYLAVKQLNPELKGQIICLYGPPGVGKTSIAASLAKAMKRKYVRVSLGGVRDEADI